MITTTASSANLSAGENDVQTFGEQISQIPIVGQMSLYYFLHRDGNNTRLRIEGHFPSLPLFKRPMLFFVKRSMHKNLSESTQRLRELFPLQAAAV